LFSGLKRVLSFPCRHVRKRRANSLTNEVRHKPLVFITFLILHGLVGLLGLTSAQQLGDFEGGLRKGQAESDQVMVQVVSR
jgi:hypothetical protein